MLRSLLMRQVAGQLPIVARVLRQQADAELAEFGVSNSMAWCLIYLDRLGQDPRQAELAEAIGISGPSTVRVLDQLETSGLVERSPNPDDKRANRISITPKGAELLSKIEVRLSKLREAFFKDVSDEDMRIFHRVLSGLSDRILERRK